MLNIIIIKYIYTIIYISIFFINNIIINSVLFVIIHLLVKNIDWYVNVIYVVKNIIKNIFKKFLYLLLFLLIINIICDNKLLYINPLWKLNNSYISSYSILSFIYIIILYIMYIISNVIFNNIIISINNKKIIYIKNKIRRYCIVYIILYIILNIIVTNNFIMSYSKNWVSTVYLFYVSISYICSSISLISIIENIIYIKYNIKNKCIYIISKYIYATSLLWMYLWYIQYLLYNYTFIDDEIRFFIKRFNNYYIIQYIIIIFNFIIPSIFLLFKKQKKNIFIINICNILILLGHYLDIYNLIIPEMFNINIDKINLHIIFYIIVVYVVILQFFFIKKCRFSKKIKN